jgi:mannosyltransferase OCH1-like enzyme
MSIPKVIHQIWIDKNGRDISYPVGYHRIRNTLIKYNPQFEFKVWLEMDILLLFNDSRLAKYRDTYRSLQHPISRADFARIMVMYKEGGIYIDLDFYGLRDMTSLIKNRQMVLCLEPVANGSGLLFNGFMATTPESPFVLGYLEYMRDTLPQSPPLWIDVVGTTGPKAFYRYAYSTPLFNPSWLVDSYLIMSHNKQGDKTPTYGDMPYVMTEWTEGSDWSHDVVYDSIKYFSQILVPVIALLLIALCLNRRFR